MILTAELRLWWPYAPAEIELLFDAWRDGGDLNIEERTDLYLLDSGQAEVGIKLRGGGKCQDGAEIKALVARLPGRGPCEAEIWVKASSATLSLDGQPIAKVRKKRKTMRLPISNGRIEEPLTAGIYNRGDGCNVELTEVSRDGGPKRWWTLGFEASGSLGSVEENLSLALDWVLPGIAQSLLADAVCGSYPAWLSNFRVADGQPSHRSEA